MNYQRLSDGVINNEIYIVSTSFLNSNLREIAESILGKPNEGEYVIYSPNGNGINILGKFVLYPNSIINSRFFTIFAKNSEVINGENPTPNFSKAKCLQIKDEVFDLSLDNSDYLLRIFSFIVSVAVSEKADFIWMDDRELLFYPTKGDIEITFAPYYFANRLI